MQRITEKNLEALAERLNRETGSPLSSYTRREDGTLRANIGNYHIDYAYGGASLVQMVSEGGGVRNVLGCGHVPKRELWDRMHAYCDGMRDAKAVTA